MPTTSNEKVRALLEMAGNDRGSLGNLIRTAVAFPIPGGNPVPAYLRDLLQLPTAELDALLMTCSGFIAELVSDDFVIPTADDEDPNPEQEHA